MYVELRDLSYNIITESVLMLDDLSANVGDLYVYVGEWVIIG